MNETDLANFIDTDEAQSVLGSLLSHSPDAWKDVQAIIGMDDLFSEEDKIVWQAMIDCNARGDVAPDYITIRSKLESSSKPNLANDYLRTLQIAAGKYTFAIEVLDGARRIKQRADLRRNSRSAAKIIAELTSGDTTELDILLQTAIDAPEATKFETLQNLADACARSDPFTAEAVTSKVAAAKLCSKSAFARAVKSSAKEQAKNQPSADGTEPSKRRNALVTADYIKLFKTWGHVARLNQLNDSIEFDGKRIDDTDLDKLTARVRDYGIDTKIIANTNHAREALVTWASKHSYHPIKDFLQAIKWDGEDHIGKLCAHFHDKNNLLDTFFRAWIVGAISRVYDGWQNPMLVLAGIQDVGKSYFAKWICPLPDLFLAQAIAPESKDSRMRLMDTFVWEVEELGSTTRKADIDALKSFLTLAEVRERKPYGHFDITKPVMASFIGTVNPDGGFLVDRTGNRRFITVTLTAINFEYATTVNVKQLWAQAMQIYRSGADWKLTTADKQRRDFANNEYMTIDPVEEFVEAAVVFTGDHMDLVTVPAILTYLADKTNVTQRAQAMSIASVMHRLGASKLRETLPNGGRTTIYRQVRLVGNAQAG
jgi:hypothetical protein